MIKGIAKFKGLKYQESNNRFLGTTNSNWGTASNWSLGRVPVTYENVSIEANCTINVAPGIVGQLVVFPSVSLTFGGTARSLTVNGNLNCLGEINMSSAVHGLTLRGRYNTCTTLTTDANASVVTYSNINGGTKQMFASPNYKWIRFAVDQYILCEMVTQGEITCTSYLITEGGFSITLPYNFTSTGGFTHSSGGNLGETIRISGGVTLKCTQFTSVTTNPSSILAANANIEVTSGNFTIGGNSGAFVLGRLTMSGTTQSISIGILVRTISNVYVNSGTVNKTSTGSDAVLTITNLQGGGSATLNGNGKTTVTNNLGGITYNP